ncbi:hypothetical protein ACP4OV_010528 [Aristida adscensionis]
MARRGGPGPAQGSGGAAAGGAAVPGRPTRQASRGSCDYELYGRLILEMLQGNHVIILPSGKKENFHAVNPGELPCSSAQLYGNYFKNMQDNFHAVLLSCMEITSRICKRTSMQSISSPLFSL